MEHFPADTARVPDQHSGRGLFEVIKRTLEKITAASAMGEDETPVSSPSKAPTAPTNGDGNSGEQTVASEDGGIDLDAMIEDARERHYEATKGEAGRPEGRIVPELVVGEQRYPDPRIWGPDIDRPLTEDEQYGRAADLVERLAARTGFDGRQRH